MTAAELYAKRCALEYRGYRFEFGNDKFDTGAFQVKVIARRPGPVRTFYLVDVFFESWPSPRPWDECWELAINEATRDFVASRLEGS